MDSQFEAKGSTLGYLFQLRLGLLFLLQRVRRDPTTTAALENLDDVQFETGDVLELVQSKHHLRSSATLTDRSVDLWKTIRVWSELMRARRFDPERTQLFLITTASAPAGSVASLLRPSDRKVAEATERLESLARSNKNEELSPAAAAFLALLPDERAVLVSAFHTLDRFPSIVDIRHELLAEVAFIVDRQFREPFLDRLEGWFLRRVIDQLRDGRNARIGGDELSSLIDDLRFQFRRDNLPIDFLLAEPEIGVPVDEDMRCFVHQLRLIAISNKRIEFAIKDYYRAFEQRSRWIREDLLHVGELEKYEAVLVEEWERRRELVLEENKSEVEDDKLQCGRELFKWVESAADIRIRTECHQAYVMRGSFHMLADKQRVGWHPDFLSKLRDLLEDAS